MIEEFIFKIEQIHGVFINMNLAYSLLSSRINEIMEDDSKTIHFGDGDPNDSKTKAYLSVNIGEFKTRIKDKGHDTKLISNLCLVSIYQLWEDEYRAKIAKEIGKNKNELLLDIFGDIRFLRQAIIHNNSQRFSDFEKIKIINSLKTRDEVFLNNSEFNEIIENIKIGLRALK